VALRYDEDNIYFFGGTDNTYSYYSKKTFRFSIPDKVVYPVDQKMNTGRAGFSIANYKVIFLCKIFPLEFCLCDWRLHGAKRPNSEAGVEQLRSLRCGRGDLVGDPEHESRQIWPLFLGRRRSWQNLRCGRLCLPQLCASNFGRSVRHRLKLLVQPWW
jgi:hypothetical protein